MLDTLGDCGLSGTEVNVVKDLCSTNQNGDKCYDVLNKISQSDEDMADDMEAVCPFSGDTCPSACQSELMEGIDELGCCFSVAIEVIANADPDVKSSIMEQLESCSIDLPSECNDNTSPIGASRTVFYVTQMAIPFALFLIAMLG